VKLGIYLAMTIGLTSCGPSPGTADAAIDGAPDGAPDAVPDAAGCGADLFFTGEYLDWSSTTTTFLGLGGTTWSVRGDTSRTDVSNFNGRVELCISRTGNSVIDAVDTANPLVYLDGVFVVDPAVFLPSGSYFSAKNFTTTAAEDFYQQTFGAGFDAARGHLLVQKLGPPIPITSSLGGTAVAVDNADDLTWTPGNSGGLVLFANIDLSSGTQTTLSSGTAFVGPTTIQLEPGKLTMTTIR
jgi:hypothetical protein